MRRQLMTLAALACVMSAGAVYGQVPSAPSSALNWLNLNRGGNPAINYYGIVRPNNQNLNALNKIQQDYNTLTQSSTNTDPNGIRATGHAATFMNYGHYYPRLNTGTGGSRPGQNTGRR